MGCCSDVERGVVLHLVIYPSWYGQLQEAVWGRTAGDDFHTGDQRWRGVGSRGQ